MLLGDRPAALRAERRLGIRRFYAVAAGRNIGVFTTWEECRQQVHRFPHSRHRCFPTREAADDWLDATIHPMDRPRRVRAVGRQRVRLVAPAHAPLFLLMFLFTVISPAAAFSVDPMVAAVAPYEAMEVAGIYPICYATLALGSGFGDFRRDGRAAVAFTLGC